MNIRYHLPLARPKTRQKIIVCCCIMFHSRVTTDHKTLASVLIINVKCQRMVGGTQRTNEYIYVVAEMVDFFVVSANFIPL